MARLLRNGSVNVFPRQRIHTCKIEELSDASFSMQSVSYQARKEGDPFFSQLLVLISSRAASEVRVGYTDVMG
jgi:hypothetical protein